MQAQGSPYTVHRIHKLAAKMRNYCVTPTSSPFRWMRPTSDPGTHASDLHPAAGVINSASPTFSPLEPLRQPSPASQSPTCGPLAEAREHAASTPAQRGTNAGPHPQASQTPGDASPGWLYSSSFVPLGSAAKNLARAVPIIEFPSPLPISAQVAHQRDAPAYSGQANLASVQAVGEQSRWNENGQGGYEKLATDPRVSRQANPAPDLALQPQRLLDRLDAELPGQQPVDSPSGTPPAALCNTHRSCADMWFLSIPYSFSFICITW